jgi:hypothetical protein
VSNPVTSPAGQLPPEPLRFDRRSPGYRPRDVDMRLNDMAMQLEAERSRADSTEMALTRALADIAAIVNRPAPGLGDLAARTAQVHRDAGIAADELLHDAAERARRIRQEAEGEAGRIMRRAEHEAFDRELAARAALDDADADGIHVRTESSREIDLVAMRAAREAELVVAEARDAAAMVLAEAADRRQVLAEELAELEALRRELGASVAGFHRRLGRAIARSVPVEVDTELLAGQARSDAPEPSDAPQAPAGPGAPPPAGGTPAHGTGRSLWERPSPDLAHAST